MYKRQVLVVVLVRVALLLELPGVVDHLQDGLVELVPLGQVMQTLVEVVVLMYNQLDLVKMEMVLQVPISQVVMGVMGWYVRY